MSHVTLILALPLCFSFVLAEYLWGDVLPVEQYAASDLPRLLHPNSHLKALIKRDMSQADWQKHIHLD